MKKIKVEIELERFENELGKPICLGHGDGNYNCKFFQYNYDDEDGNYCSELHKYLSTNEQSEPVPDKNCPIWKDVPCFNGHVFVGVVEKGQTCECGELTAMPTELPGLFDAKVK